MSRNVRGAYVCMCVCVSDVGCARICVIQAGAIRVITDIEVVRNDETRREHLSPQSGWLVV